MTEMGDGHDESDWMNAKTMVKPDDQLQLSEAVSARPWRHNHDHPYREIIDMLLWERYEYDPYVLFTIVVCERFNRN